MMTEELQKLPEEQPLSAPAGRPLSVEASLAFWLMWPALLGVVAGGIYADDLLAYLITLDPSRMINLSVGFTLRNLTVSLVLPLCLAIWWSQCLLERKHLAPWSNVRHIAFLSGVLLTLIFNLAWSLPGTRWMFLEASKVRAEQFSLARSVAFWKADSLNFPTAIVPENSLWVVGSSQVNFGVDEQQLQSQLENHAIRKKTLPGFGVLQYLFTVEELLQDRPLAVVCLLSEFDFYREDELPVNRLRYFANGTGVAGLTEIMAVTQVWSNRAGFADLGLAAIAPLWRDRDLLRKMVFGFWNPVGQNIADGESQRPDLDDPLEQGRLNLGREVKRSRLLEVNFKAFESFAVKLRENGISLLVFEGMTNPLATHVYPPDYRVETRKRLQEMSSKAGFAYFDESKMPKFSGPDFVDAYHLGLSARGTLTAFVAETLKNSKLLQ